MSKISKTFELSITIETPFGKKSNESDWDKLLVDKMTKTVKRFPAETLPRMLAIVGTDIWQKAERKKWRRIPPAVLWAVTGPGEGEVFAERSQQALMNWLHYGTKDHPVTPKPGNTLHWIDPKTGKDRFSKGHKVRGIKPTFFFSYSPGAKRSVNAYLNSIQRG